MPAFRAPSLLYAYSAPKTPWYASEGYTLKNQGPAWLNAGAEDVGEICNTCCSLLTGTNAEVSAEQNPPIIYFTLSALISLFPALEAVLGSHIPSSKISWIGRPFTPPSAWISSTAISMASFTERPKSATCHVKGRTTPTLIGVFTCFSLISAPQPARASTATSRQSIMMCLICSVFIVPTSPVWDSLRQTFNEKIYINYL